ncbi:25031_t:CDS:2 [Cetraspora pellucida]|uniref:25031_t:CDS:1 n=1 Tax=Cetraspora pellucida TaxID=1433469 RepID=A0A9N9ESI9_9GLOM|nr:25031_t:CDS:2 [Cetraspora pellucida]
MENKDSLQTCNRCNCTCPLKDFIVDESNIRARCMTCHINTSQAKKRKQQEINDYIVKKENIINLFNVTDFIYYILLEYKNLNDNLEWQTPFQLKFDIDLDSIYENISTDIIAKEKNIYIADLEIRLTCNLDNKLNNDYPINNDFSSINEINKPSTINMTQEIYETNDDFMDEIEQKHS